MTEIPDHLLQRTRSRRQALGLPVSGVDGAGDGAAAAPASGGGVATTTSGNLPKGPVAPSGSRPTSKAAARPAAPYAEASARRTRIPVWAMPVVAILPLWALLYAGTMTKPHSKTPTLVEAGGEVFSAAGCAGCHGASGGGGVGPAIAKGAVIATYPNPVDQVRWVILGSTGGGELYAKAGKTSIGGMPAFGETLTLSQIVEVVLHERQTLSGQKAEADAEGWADLRKLPEEFSALGYTSGEVEMILEEMAAQEGISMPEHE